MTVGTVIVGATASPYYFRKDWSGANGLGTAKRPQWNAYSCTIQQAVQKPSQFYKAVAGCDGGRFLGIPSYENLSWTTADEYALLDGLIQQIRGHEFNLGVAAAEGKEAVSMVASRARAIFQGIRALKKGRIDQALFHLGASPKGNHKYNVSNISGKGPRFNQLTGALETKDVSGFWLEMQYGWIPLLSDCYNAMEAYATIANKDRVMRFTASHSGSTLATVVSSIAGGYWWDISTKTSDRIIYEMKEVQPVQRSLGLENPLSVAWELVPFSFVADWFIPIGSYFDLLGQAPHLTGRYVRTRRITTKTNGKQYPTVSTSCAYNGFYKASCTLSRKRIIRTVGAGGLAVPKPEFVPLSKALSLGHLKNSVALLHQMFT